MDKNTLLRLYKRLYQARRFEEVASQAYTTGLIGGFCHLYIGQEAIAIGVQEASEKDDLHITTYRDHVHMIACGMKPEGIMAELMGRKDGYSKGKGGSMHMFSRDKNFFGGHGIVGANIPIGTGLALAQKYKDVQGTTFCYFGDGAINQGQFYEALNMASLWNIPIVYIIENNGYAMGTSVERSTSQPELHRRGEGWNVKGVSIEGFDVRTVYEKAKETREYVMSNNCPAIIEFVTYRHRGHSMSDPATYRSKKEVQDIRKEKDPIKIAEAVLVDMGLDESTIKEIKREVDSKMEQVLKFSENCPYPDDDELVTDVLIENP